MTGRKRVEESYQRISNCVYLRTGCAEKCGIWTRTNERCLRSSPLKWLYRLDLAWPTRTRDENQLAGDFSNSLTILGKADTNHRETPMNEQAHAFFPIRMSWISDCRQRGVFHKAFKGRATRKKTSLRCTSKFRATCRSSLSGVALLGP